MKEGDKKAYNEKTLLFNKLIILSGRNEGIGEIFSFEMTPTPTSLFTMEHNGEETQKA